MIAIGFVLAVAGAVPASAQVTGDGTGMMGTMPTMGMMGPGQGPGMDVCHGTGAQPIAFGPELPWIGFALAHTKDLGLSEEQVTQLAGLRDEFLKGADALVQDIRAGENALTQLYAQKPLDLAAVEAKIKEIAGREAEVRILRLKTLQKGAALLTEEQRQKLVDPAWRMGRMMGSSTPAPTF
jgi:Spy/CpxP family protein refolding chaperone